MCSISESLVLCVCLISIVRVSHAWSGTDYPNPQTDAAGCGRAAKSWICDPDSLLNVTQADEIDKELNEIYLDTACPCNPGGLCGSGSPAGYKVYLALVKGLPGEPNADNSDAVAKTTAFTKNLLADWGKSSKCGEEVVVLYDINTNNLITEAGSTAAKRLSEELRGEIVMRERINLGKTRDYFRGLKNIIAKYRAVMQGKYVSIYQRLNQTNIGAVLGTSGVASATKSAAKGSVLAVSIATGLLFFRLPVVN